MKNKLVLIAVILAAILSIMSFTAVFSIKKNADSEDIKDTVDDAVVSEIPNDSTTDSVVDPEPELCTFYAYDAADIHEYTFQCEKGMTIKEFIESEYSKGQWEGSEECEDAYELITFLGYEPSLAIVEPVYHDNGEISYYSVEDTDSNVVWSFDLPINPAEISDKFNCWVIGF